MFSYLFVLKTTLQSDTYRKYFIFNGLLVWRILMKNLENGAVLLARIMMPILFIVAGYGKLGDAYAGTQQYMQAMGVPGFYYL